MVIGHRHVANKSLRTMLLQIVAASSVEAGRQVHNTYGELGSAELVAKYGFALPPDAANPFDAVTLDKGSVIKEAGRLISARALRARCRFLAEERYAPASLPLQGHAGRGGDARTMIHIADLAVLRSCIAYINHPF